MKVFIPHNNCIVKDKRRLFILTRPFYKNSKWTNDSEEKQKYGLKNDDFQFVENIEQAEIVLLPFSINFYFSENKGHELESLNSLCQKYSIKTYGTVFHDFGIAFPDFSNIIYLRASGFKSQLSKQNKGFPVILSDHFQLLYKQETIVPRVRNELPSIGFCGHATFSFTKRIKESLVFIRENLKRIFKKSFRKDWEPLFASAYERALLLSYFEKSDRIKTNFIYREKYRGGAITQEQRTKTTLEYYNNIFDSDYVLCIRGAGNFSVRFYETLMMGRIPIFVNTDCLLPFEDQINWKSHVVWVEWSDRKNIASIVSDFHEKITNEDFITMQINNRKLWKETLSLTNLMHFLRTT